MNFSFLCDVSGDVANFLTTLRSIVLILTALASVVIIVAVLCQPSNPDGGRNVITGTNDSYYAQNKGATKEGRLKRLIIICAAVVLVLTIAFYVIEHFFGA